MGRESVKRYPPFPDPDDSLGGREDPDHRSAGAASPRDLRRSDVCFPAGRRDPHPRVCGGRLLWGLRGPTGSRWRTRMRVDRARTRYAGCQKAAERIVAARPTAVNLAFGVERAMRAVEAGARSGARRREIARSVRARGGYAARGGSRSLAPHGEARRCRSSRVGARSSRTATRGAWRRGDSEPRSRWLERPRKRVGFRRSSWMRRGLSCRGGG